MKVAKINADWGTDDIRIIVGRNINGITLNGYEYITDNNNFLIGFISEKSARDYLHRHGISDNDIQYLEFFYRTDCPNCGEEVIVKIYDAKIENGFKTIVYMNIFKDSARKSSVLRNVLTEYMVCRFTAKPSMRRAVLIGQI